MVTTRLRLLPKKSGAEDSVPSAYSQQPPKTSMSLRFIQYAGLALALQAVWALNSAAWAFELVRADALPGQSTDSISEAHRHFEFLGTRSCFAVSCHGNAESPGLAGSEAIVWLEKGPHAKAQQSLWSSSGKRMLELLGITPEDAGFQNCLACHSPWSAAHDGASNWPPCPPNVAEWSASPIKSLAPRPLEGVGCEACHGPSDSWAAEHYKPGWKTRTATSKSVDFGMTDTNNIAVRARECAKCHVGAADRQVNHDLIAAGHPPLKFELAAYLDMLPKH